MAKKTVPKEEFDNLKRWYAEEIKRKDERIEELKVHNELLVRSSLKTSERLSMLEDVKKKKVKK